MQKEPKVGGAWEWHQDYGYWYKNEFLFPDQMISVMVAITKANKENGCLQVIKGSHKLGRIEHGFSYELEALFLLDIGDGARCIAGRRCGAGARR